MLLLALFSNSCTWGSWAQNYVLSLDLLMSRSANIVVSQTLPSLFHYHLILHLEIFFLGTYLLCRFSLLHFMFIVEVLAFCNTLHDFNYSLFPFYIYGITFIYYLYVTDVIKIWLYYWYAWRLVSNMQSWGLWNYFLLYKIQPE